MAGTRNLAALAAALERGLDDYVYDGIRVAKGEPGEGRRYQDAREGSEAAEGGEELALRVADEIGDIAPEAAAKLREAAVAFVAANSGLSYIWVRGHNDPDRFDAGLAALEAGYGLAHEAADLLRKASV